MANRATPEGDSEGELYGETGTERFASFVRRVEARKRLVILDVPEHFTERCANAYIRTIAILAGEAPPQVPTLCEEAELWEEVRADSGTLWKGALFLGVVSLRSRRTEERLAAASAELVSVLEGPGVKGALRRFLLLLASRLLLMQGTTEAVRRAAAMAGERLQEDAACGTSVAVWMQAAAHLGVEGAPLRDAAARARTVSTALAQMEAPHLRGHGIAVEGCAELLYACGECEALDALVEESASEEDWEEKDPAHRSRLRRLQALALLNGQGPRRGMSDLEEAIEETVRVLQCRVSFGPLPVCAADAASVMAALKCNASPGVVDEVLQEMTLWVSQNLPLPGASPELVAGCCWGLMLGGRGREAQALLREHANATSSTSAPDFPLGVFPTVGADAPLDACTQERLGGELWQVEAMLAYMRGFKMHCELIAGRRHRKAWAVPGGGCGAFTEPFEDVLSRAHEFFATHMFWTSSRLLPPRVPGEGDEEKGKEDEASPIRGPEQQQQPPQHPHHPQHQEIAEIAHLPQPPTPKPIAAPDDSRCDIDIRTWASSSPIPAPRVAGEKVDAEAEEDMALAKRWELLQPPTVLDLLRLCADLELESQDDRTLHDLLLRPTEGELAEIAKGGPDGQGRVESDIVALAYWHFTRMDRSKRGWVHLRTVVAILKRYSTSLGLQQTTRETLEKLLPHIPLVDRRIKRDQWVAIFCSAWHSA
eukprot:Hpha_TRINITY_DN6875_c0_g1::TRINITY_DN6875_c0_g1_i1::g.46199::m.46199